MVSWCCIFSPRKQWVLPKNCLAQCFLRMGHGYLRPRGRYIYIYHIYSSKHGVHVDMSIMGKKLKATRHSDHLVYYMLNISK